MATAEAPVIEPIPEPIPERSDVEEIARGAALRYQAHEGIMLESALRTKAKAAKMEKFAATGDPKDLEFTADEEAAMAVNIGNQNHYHLLREAEKQPVSVVAPVVSAAKSKLGPMLLAAVLGGGLTTAGLLAFLEWRRPDSNPPSVQPTNPNDWQLGIEVTDQP